jgi:hypothetical protein
MGGGEIANVAGVAAISGGAGEGLVIGHSNQPITATASTAAAAAILVAAIRPRRDAGAGTLAAGNSATVSGGRAKTRTDRAMFLTLCSPLSSNG